MNGRKNHGLEIFTKLYDIEKLKEDKKYIFIKYKTIVKDKISNWKLGIIMKNDFPYDVEDLKKFLKTKNVFIQFSPLEKLKQNNITPKLVVKIKIEDKQ